MLPHDHAQHCPQALPMLHDACGWQHACCLHWGMIAHSGAIIDAVSKGTFMMCMLTCTASFVDTSSFSKDEKKLLRGQGLMSLQSGPAPPNSGLDKVLPLYG